MRRIILDISRNPKQKRFASISKRVAVVFCAVLFCAAITTVSVDAYRQRFMKYIVKVTRHSTDYDFVVATDKYYNAIWQRLCITISQRVLKKSEKCIIRI